METSHREPQELPHLNNEAEREKGGNRATDRPKERRPRTSQRASLESRRANLRSGTEMGRALPTSAVGASKGSSGRAEAACKLWKGLLHPQASQPGQEPTLGRNYWDRNQNLSEAGITEEGGKGAAKDRGGYRAWKPQTASHLPCVPRMNRAQESELCGVRDATLS